MKKGLPRFTRAALSWYQMGQTDYEEPVDTIPPRRRRKIPHGTSANRTNNTFKERDAMTSGAPLRDGEWLDIWQIDDVHHVDGLKKTNHIISKDGGKASDKIHHSFVESSACGEWKKPASIW